MFSYTNLIEACRNKPEEALKIYEVMKTENETPTRITFSILLSIQGKAGHLSGLLYAWKEFRFYNLKPSKFIPIAGIRSDIRGRRTPPRGR